MVALWRKRRETRITQQLQEETEDLQCRVDRQNTSLSALTRLLSSWAAETTTQGGNNTSSCVPRNELMFEDESSRHDERDDVDSFDEENTIVQQATDQAIAALRERLEHLDEDSAALRSRLQKAREKQLNMLREQKNQDQRLKELQTALGNSGLSFGNEETTMRRRQLLKSSSADESTWSLKSTMTASTIASDDTSCCFSDDDGDFTVPPSANLFSACSL